MKERLEKVRPFLVYDPTPLTAEDLEDDKMKWREDWTRVGEQVECLMLFGTEQIGGKTMTNEDLAAIKGVVEQVLREANMDEFAIRYHQEQQALAEAKALDAEAKPMEDAADAAMEFPKVNRMTTDELLEAQQMISELEFAARELEEIADVPRLTYAFGDGDNIKKAASRRARAHRNNAEAIRARMLDTLKNGIEPMKPKSDIL